MSVVQVKNTKKTETFDSKVKMLDVSIDEQIKMLNKLYENKLEFGKSSKGLIQIINFNDSINVIELPECSNLDMEELINFWSFNIDSLCTIKLPKCIEAFEINRADWVNYIDRLFMWDCTSLYGLDHYYENRNGNRYRLDKLIILPIAEGKAKVYSLH